MKKVLWFFSVLYVVFPAALAWFVWVSPDVVFRDGLGTQAKWWITATCILMAVVANIAAWSNYLGWKKTREER